jgi:hypothetical protein
LCCDGRSGCATTLEDRLSKVIKSIDVGCVATLSITLYYLLLKGVSSDQIARSAAIYNLRKVTEDHSNCFLWSEKSRVRTSNKEIIKKL